jgi:glyoxylase-like metal-dependent hydrolase (beta-lactamase superfamily II)
MIVRQFLHEQPVTAASYLLGCAGHGVGAVVDPVWPAEDYRNAAEQLGVRIVFVIDTHVHADHRSTGPELAAATGAKYVLHASAGVLLAFMPVHEGQRLDLGNVQLVVVHTPGHTPEHLSLLVIDGTRAPEPWAVLTGHTLMVGDLGRTELASDARAGAKALFATATRLRHLPDHVEVWPGAFLGSVCGRGLSGKPSSTIGFERRFNRAFAIEDERAFVEAMLERIPAPPPDAERTRRRNLGLAEVVA